MPIRRIGILVVHGVGEQRRFEHLEQIASNLYRALNSDPDRKAHLQILRGDQIPQYSPTDSWREAPALVSWCRQPGNVDDRIEVLFREVHWADLDMPVTFQNWIYLISWALGMSGVRLFTSSDVWTGRAPYMCLPRNLTSGERVWVWTQLFGLSVLFFLMLVSIDLLYFIFTRFSSQAKWLQNIRTIIYDYLGDVKLFQDWFNRDDNNLETLGEKSRVAIRRRMVRALLQTAAEVDRGYLAGYYIFAHSLGTVVAFNALMELEVTLPNYLTEQEWNGLPFPFKRQANSNAPTSQQPRRPPWLGPRDAINRDRVFAGLRGVLTMGSPLDKFAAMWPVIVPVNKQPVRTPPHTVPWINVADSQDIVAGTIDLFGPCNGAPGIGGLELRNVEWADQPWLFTAHTSYWKWDEARQDRLINRVIPWLEGGPFDPPDTSQARLRLFKLIYAASLLALSGILLFLSAGLVWVTLEKLLQRPVLAWFTFSAIPWRPFVTLMLFICFLGALVVGLFSIVRWGWEKRTINP